MVKSFHSHLNSIEPHIQFTVEEESEDRLLPFLDMELCRDSDGTVTTLVYRKATHTNQYLSFASHHPFKHKVVVYSEDPHVQSQHTVILRCTASGGAEDCRCT